jgi:hypothetical protein
MPLSQIVSASIEDGAVAPVDLSSVAQYTGFKNRLINGAMGIWQRGTTLTGTGAAAAQYLADRWGAGTLTSSFVMSRSTDVPSGIGFPYSLKIQRTAGQTSTAQANAIQVIESNNMLDLAGQSVTLSFWAKCGANYSQASSGLTIIIETGTVADQSLYNAQGAWTGAAYPVNTTATLTTSWQKFTYTGTVGSTVLGMCVYFAMTPVGTAGADDSFYITGVQLEKGVTATSFDYRPFGTELVLCQRYYETTDVLYTLASWTTAANQAVWRVTKRVLPTIVNTPGFGSGGVYSPFQSGVAAVYQSSNNSVASGGTITGSAEL